MNKSVIVITVIILLILISGFNIIRNVLVSSINVRLDSSEALLFNEINSRLYRDFNTYPSPTDISWSEDSFEYRNREGELVQLNNIEKEIQITVHRRDGSRWFGRAKGNIEVEEVHEIHIPKEDIKINLDNTHSRVYAITFRVLDDLSKKRVSLNREYTTFYSIVKGDNE